MAREAVLSEYDDEFTQLFARTVVTKNWKLTCYAGKPYGEFFDLNNDPDELHNLWQDPGYAGVRQELKEVMLDTIIKNASLREPRFDVYA